MTAKAPEPAKNAASTGSLPAQPVTGSTPSIAAAPAAPKASAAPAKAIAAAPARPGRPAAKAGRRGADGSLVVLSVLAVLVALGATGIAIYALDQARAATTRANEAFSVADRAAASAPAKSVTPPKASTTPAPTASRGPAFVAELVHSTLRVPAADSPCASAYVDIDSMSVGTFTGHEFYLTNCVGPLSVHVDRTSGAVPTANNPTPEVCAAQITGATSTGELVLPIIDGLTFCLVTNKADAAQLGNPQRIAIVEVSDVAADNSVTLSVSTYRVPTGS